MNTNLPPSVTEPPVDVERVSQILARLAVRPTATVSVDDILMAFGERAFGALLVMFAAPLVLPMPPGVSAVLGAPLMFIAFQLMIGRHALWLPATIRRREIRRDDFARMTARVTPYLDRLEGCLRPRLLMLFNPVSERVVGAACLLLALIVFLPIPLGNMLPSFAIAAFGFGLMIRDGVAALVGWISGGSSLLVLAALWHVVWIGVKALLVMTGIQI